MADIKVTMLSHTEEPEKIVTAAAKLCYSSSQIDDLMNNLTDENIDKFVSMLSDLGHESPFEHASFTFAIEGVSRITEQQLTRHRLASYSIQSGRYVTRGNAGFVIPPSIKPGTFEYEAFKNAADKSKQAYEDILISLKQKYVQAGMKEGAAEKKAAEDARYIFPNSLQTKIIVTMNVRSLWNFFTHRCCNRAQWEIRQLARLMLAECKQVAPLLFKNAGPACIQGLGCPENSMQCSEFKKTVPTQKEIKELAKALYGKRE